MLPPPAENPPAETINKCLLHVHTCNKHMAHSASDAANEGAMVVHTTEDNPVGDGDPICELARGEREIGEEREERERGKRGRRDRNEHFADEKSIS